MYTDGFDELSEAENRPPRTYVSTGSQDMGKLQRDNERLKKSLEKEQFFNRLLDQELKDLKSSQAGGSGYDPQQFNRRRGVSKSSFNTLLAVTIALAGFIAYLLYSGKPFNLFSKPAAVAAPLTPAFAGHPSPTDSVPNIISSRKANTATQSSQQSLAPAEKKKPAVEPKAKVRITPDEQSDDAAADETTTEPAATPAAPVASVAAPAVTRPVIAQYIVTSKANFYNAPDENTLRSYFISPASDKIVNALEEKNGFIYVEFKNDVGYVTKGWLSKADLTRQ